MFSKFIVFASHFVLFTKYWRQSLKHFLKNANFLALCTSVLADADIVFGKKTRALLKLFVKDWKPHQLRRAAVILLVHGSLTGTNPFFASNWQILHCNQETRFLCLCVSFLQQECCLHSCYLYMFWMHSLNSRGPKALTVQLLGYAL